MKIIQKILIGFGVLFVVLQAFVFLSDDEPKDAQNVAPPVEEAAENTEDLDKGDFVIVFEQPTGEAENAVYEILRHDDTFRNLLDAVNEIIALPKHVPVRFRSCGQSNAFYDPENRDISMCYELFLDYLNILSDDKMTDEELGNMVNNAATFILFHEMGHCLVDNLDIPITGKEEDAVDDFAAIFAVNLDDAGENIIFSSIVGFGAWADEEDVDNMAFSDEHSLSAQRFYSIACILYGSNPEKYASMVGEDLLPPDRAERCPSEFEQKSNSWQRLLGPYIKTGSP